MSNENYYPIELNNEGDGFVIINNGTAPAPCVLTIIPKVDLLHITIEGLSENPIEVKNVKAQDVLVIDGEKSWVYLNDKTNFSNFLAWEFPKLQVGENKIKITNASQMSIQIEYNPRYI